MLFRSIFLVISFVGVSVYLYFNPVDRNIPLENAYFVAFDEKYVKLLRNGAVNRNTAKSSDTVTVSNTMMLGLLVDGVESIDLEYYPIDSSTFESVMSPRAAFLDHNGHLLHFPCPERREHRHGEGDGLRCAGGPELELIP